jgi:tetratricopeptide (TPR) repeat protein
LNQDAGTSAGSGPTDPAPLFGALRAAYAGARSGRLHLINGRELRQLRFLAGSIADASSDLAGERLGDVLVRDGILGQADLGRAVEVVLGERRRLGPILAELGLEKERIREAIGLHVQEIVFAALDRPGLSVVFEELPERLVETDFECPLSVGQLILVASRRVDAVLVSRAIAGDGRALALSTDARLRSQAIVLTPTEGFVLSRIDGTSGAGDLAGVIPLPPEEVERSLYSLLSTGLITFADAMPRPRRERPAAPNPPPAETPPVGTPAPSAPASLPSASHPPPAATPEETRKTILDAHRGLGRTHYEVLGVGQDAREADIRAAYARLMKTFHPDAARAPGLADVEEQRQAVCLRAGEAYDVLRHREARAAYDNNLKLWKRTVPAPPPPASGATAGSPSTPDTVTASAPSRSAAAAAPAGPPPAAPPEPAGGSEPAEEDLLAAAATAEKLVEDGEFWDAIQLLEPLLPRMRGQLRARARMALARAYARNPKWQRRAEAALRLAIEDSPRDVEARLMLAGLYLDLGLHARSGAIYRTVLEMDPGNAAARAALRDTHPVAPAERAGVLKRLTRKR